MLPPPPLSLEAPSPLLEGRWSAVPRAHAAAFRSRGCAGARPRAPTQPRPREEEVLRPTALRCPTRPARAAASLEEGVARCAHGHAGPSAAAAAVAAAWLAARRAQDRAGRPRRMLRGRTQGAAADGCHPPRVDRRQSPTPRPSHPPVRLRGVPVRPQSLRQHTA